VPESIQSLITDVSPGHWRIQAVTISSSNSKTLLINTYFPCDEGRSAGVNLDEAMELIGLITKVIEENSCQAVILCGDINTDFRRNKGQVELVNEFLEDLLTSNLMLLILLLHCPNHPGGKQVMKRKSCTEPVWKRS
jgi:hypothetical protein